MTQWNWLNTLETQLWCSRCAREIGHTTHTSPAHQVHRQIWSSTCLVHPLHSYRRTQTQTPVPVVRYRFTLTKKKKKKTGVASSHPRILACFVLRVIVCIYVHDGAVEIKGNFLDFAIFQLRSACARTYESIQYLEMEARKVFNAL